MNMTRTLRSAVLAAALWHMTSLAACAHAAVAAPPEVTAVPTPKDAVPNVTQPTPPCLAGYALIRNADGPGSPPGCVQVVTTAAPEPMNASTPVPNKVRDLILKDQLIRPKAGEDLYGDPKDGMRSVPQGAAPPTGFLSDPVPASPPTSATTGVLAALPPVACYLPSATTWSPARKGDKDKSVLYAKSTCLPGYSPDYLRIPVGNEYAAFFAICCRKPAP